MDANNVLLLHQDIFTISPIIIGGLVFLLYVTGKWKHEKILMLNLVIDGICLSLVNFGYIETGVFLILIASLLSVIYALFRRRKCEFYSKSLS